MTPEVSRLRAALLERCRPFFNGEYAVDALLAAHRRSLTETPVFDLDAYRQTHGACFPDDPEAA